MIEDEIRKAASDLGIDLIGFFSVEPLAECLPNLKKRFDEGLSTGFEGAPPEERIDYQRHFPDAKSGIVIGVNNYQSFEKPQDDKNRGMVASVSWGEDYHVILRALMNELMIKINIRQKLVDKPLVNYKVFVDNSPLVDRGSAYRSGLGFFGKNNCLINQTFGSYFFIGQILLDIKVSSIPEKPISGGCGECRRCIDACPNQALGNGYTLDPSKCISFLTQKKGLSGEEETRIKQYLYGCDICQQVCPYNQTLKTTAEKRFWTNPEMVYPEIEKILALTNNKFKEGFGKTGGGWRGKNVLIRNALLIEKNKKNHD